MEADVLPRNLEQNPFGNSPAADAATGPGATRPPERTPAIPQHSNIS
jgi:hypothetical protein